MLLPEAPPACVTLTPPGVNIVALIPSDFYSENHDIVTPRNRTSDLEALYVLHAFLRAGRCPDINGIHVKNHFDFQD